MDKNQRNSRRALGGNVAFVALAAAALWLANWLFPSIPTWILATLFGLSCIGLLGDLINLAKRVPKHRP